MNKYNEDESESKEGSLADECESEEDNHSEEPEKRRSKKSNFRLVPVESKHHAQKIVEWSEEEDRRLFSLYKERGSCWSSIASEFSGRTENQVKNRFYSTLRRLATKDSSSLPAGEQAPKTKKKDLLKYVDAAIVHGHNCRSKRGRKRKVPRLPPPAVVVDSVVEAVGEAGPADESKKPSESPGVNSVAKPIVPGDVLSGTSRDPTTVTNPTPVPTPTALPMMQTASASAAILASAPSSLPPPVALPPENPVTELTLMGEDCIRTAISQNESALRLFDQKVGGIKRVAPEASGTTESAESELAELLLLQQDIESRLKYTQQVIDVNSLAEDYMPAKRACI